MRPSKFESHDESSRRVLHKAHLAKAFFSNGLIDRFTLMLLVFERIKSRLLVNGLLDIQLRPTAMLAWLLVLLL